MLHSAQPVTSHSLQTGLTQSYPRIISQIATVAENPVSFSSLTLRMKGLVLSALMSKKARTNKNAIKNHLWRWYANSSTRLHELAVDRFVTSGKINVYQVLYLMKMIARKNAPPTSVTIIQIEQDEKSIPSQKGFRIQESEGCIKVRNVVSLPNSSSLECDQKKTKSKIDPQCLKRHQISINRIITEVEDALGGAEQENSKCKESISMIEPPSGSKLEIISCANLFENSQNEQSRKSARLASIIQMDRIAHKLKNKVLFKGFQKLMESMFEQDYEEELLKARRNLELVQQNFMVECQMDTLSLNYEEQSEHLETIDRNIQVLKQKFMYSQTSSIIRVLRKFFYPQLACIFCKLRSEQRSDNRDNKVYEIYDVNPVSSTSLSNRAYSSQMLNHEAEFQQGIWVDSIRESTSKRDSIGNRCRIFEQNTDY